MKSLTLTGPAYFGSFALQTRAIEFHKAARASPLSFMYLSAPALPCQKQIIVHLSVLRFALPADLPDALVLIIGSRAIPLLLENCAWVKKSYSAAVLDNACNEEVLKTGTSAVTRAWKKLKSGFGSRITFPPTRAPSNVLHIFHRK